jgi:uncharacterized protein (DUF1697 family)
VSGATTYVAFIRAINVAGRGIVRMTDLQKAFAAAGCRNVRTVIQSGNVLFEAAQRSAPRTFRQVRAALRKLLDTEPEIVFRTLEDLERIARGDPFKRFAANRALKFYVVFLAQAPALRPKLPVVSEKEAVEAIALKDSDVFIVSRRKKNGFYGFPNGIVEAEFGVPATSRNWSTVTKIIALAQPSARRVRPSRGPGRSPGKS